MKTVVEYQTDSSYQTVKFLFILLLLEALVDRISGAVTLKAQTLILHLQPSKLLCKQ